MTAPIKDRPSGAGAPPAGKGKTEAVAFRPFVAGTRRVDKATYDNTRTLNASTQDLPVYNVDPNGYLRGMYIIVTCTTATNAATVTFNQNGPFNVLDSVTFNDTNNKPLMGPFNGYDLYIAIKYGGYNFQDDTKASQVYSATTGAGATGGSFQFVLNLPVEVARRDGLGSLTNKSSSSTYDLTIRLAANATVYGTPPTNPGSVRVRVQQYGWMDPNSADMKGRPVAQNPPANQTTQYWSKQTYPVNSGAIYVTLQGLDSMVRNFVFMNVDNAGSRTVGETDWFDPTTMQYETSQPMQRLKTTWQQMIAEQFGYDQAIDTAKGRDSGVFPEVYNYDFSSKPGNETRLGYLPVSSATNVALNGTMGGSGAHTIGLLINKIVPANGDPMSLTGV